MKTAFSKLLLFIPLLMGPGCVAPRDQGWHRPAKQGDRIGQVLSIEGSLVTVSIAEPCLVHQGDLLTVKRIYWDPDTGKKDDTGGHSFPSGSLKVKSVNADDHTLTGNLQEGTASVDSAVFMGQGFYNP